RRVAAGHRRAQRLLPAGGRTRGLQPATRPGGADDEGGVVMAVDGGGRVVDGRCCGRRGSGRTPGVTARVEATYYDRPAIKEPVWVPSVPAYFYVGGVAGASAVLGC